MLLRKNYTLVSLLGKSIYDWNYILYKQTLKTHITTNLTILVMKTKTADTSDETIRTGKSNLRTPGPNFIIKDLPSV